METPLFSRHSLFSPFPLSFPCSFRRCHLKPLKFIFLCETYIPLPNVPHHWVVPLTPWVQCALDWTYLLCPPTCPVSCQRIACHILLLSLNHPSVNHCFLPSVSSYCQFPTSGSNIYYIHQPLNGSLRFILTCPYVYCRTTKISFLKNTNWDVTCIVKVKWWGKHVSWKWRQRNKKNLE